MNISFAFNYFMYKNNIFYLKARQFSIIFCTKKSDFPPEAAFFMQNTEGVPRPPLSQKAPASIACRVFFGQKPTLYGQKTPAFYPNTEGVIKRQTLDYQADNQAFSVKKGKNTEGFKIKRQGDQFFQA